MNLQHGEVARDQLLERPLPNHAEDERCVLSIPIFHPEQLSRVVGAFRTEDFYVPLNRKVFRAFEHIEEADKTPDPLTIVATLREIEDSSPVSVSEVMSITSGVPHFLMSDKSVQQMVTRIHDASDRRKAYKMLDRTGAAILEGDTELIDELTVLEEAFDSLRVRQSRKYDGFELLADFADEMNTLYEMYYRGETTAIPTGIPELDENLAERGFSVDDLIIIAARTAFGKTSLALNIAGNMARAGHTVGYISREMTKYRLFKRLHAIEVQINAGRIRPSVMSNRDLAILKQTLQIMRSLPIMIDDKTPNVHRIRRNVRDAVRTRGMKALFVDYLQLLRASDKTREATNRVAEVSTVSTTLKEIAQDLRIPVIALSQFSRAAISENGKVRRPVLSDLRESGQIEQDAGVVLFLHSDTPQEDWANTNERDMECIIAKQRDGWVTSFPMQFDASYLTFTTEQVASLVSARVDAYANLGSDAVVVADGGEAWN